MCQHFYGRNFHTSVKSSSFSILCIIGNTRFEKAMLDLGSSINVMTYSIYVALDLGSLKEIDIVFQLAHSSNACPVGVLEDVLF